MVAIQDHIGEFEDAGATVLGVSADSAFSLEAFAEECGLEFDLVSDMDGAAIDAYDLAIDIPELGLHDVANRAAFVLDEEGTVSHEWVAEDPTDKPDYEELVAAAEEAA